MFCLPWLATTFQIAAMRCKWCVNYCQIQKILDMISTMKSALHPETNYMRCVGFLCVKKRFWQKSSLFWLNLSPRVVQYKISIIYLWIVPVFPKKLSTTITSPAAKFSMSSIKPQWQHYNYEGLSLMADSVLSSVWVLIVHFSGTKVY